MSDRRKILMIATWFPPCELWPTAATRARLFVEGLADHGWRPHVLVPDLAKNGICGCAGCTSAVDRDRGPAFVERLHVRPTRLRRLRRLARRSSSGTPTILPQGSEGEVGAVRRLAWLVSESSTDWPDRARARSAEIIRDDPPAAVWTTSGPFSNASLGARLKRGDLPWIADLRDPASTNVTAPDAPSRALVAARRIFLRPQLRRADALVAATRQVLDLDSPWLARHIEFVPTGYDEQRWASARAAASARRSNNAMEVMFAGVLYERYRRPDTFLDGLRAFAQRLSADERRRVRFVYFGRSGDLLRRLAAEFDVADLIDDRGFVSPDSVPERLCAASVLLLLTNEVGDSGVPGGKFFEYLAAHRPVLAVPGSDRFAAEVLAETGAGVGASTPQEVCDELTGWFKSWQASGVVPYGGDQVAVARYGSRASVERLDELVRTLTCGGLAEGGP